VNANFKSRKNWSRDLAGRKEISGLSSACSIQNVILLIRVVLALLGFAALLNVSLGRSQERNDSEIVRETVPAGFSNPMSGTTQTQP
jgi:hypothetical protein